MAAKRAAVVAAPCGQMPQYVGTRGEGWRAPLENQNFKLPSAATRCAPMPSPSLKLFVLPGLEWQATKHVTIADNFRKADAVLVDSVSGRWEHVLALGARLYGKRLCDVEWAKSHDHKARKSSGPQSGPERGTCVHFSPATQLSLTVAFSQKFEEKWPKHAKEMEKAALIDGGNSGKNQKGLHFIRKFEVNTDDLRKPQPEKGTTALLCLTEWEMCRLKNRPTWAIGLKGLMDRLSVPR